MHLLIPKAWRLSDLTWNLERDIIWQDWDLSIDPINCQYIDIGQPLGNSKPIANMDRLGGSH